jgi:hypothetical protein
MPTRQRRTSARITPLTHPNQPETDHCTHHSPNSPQNSRHIIDAAALAPQEILHRDRQCHRPPQERLAHRLLCAALRASCSALPVPGTCLSARFQILPNTCNTCPDATRRPARWRPRKDEHFAGAHAASLHNLRSATPKQEHHGEQVLRYAMLPGEICKPSARSVLFRVRSLASPGRGGKIPARQLGGNHRIGLLLY